MDFAYSKKVEDLRSRLLGFMDEHIYPNEPIFYAEIAQNRNQRLYRQDFGICFYPVRNVRQKDLAI